MPEPHRAPRAFCTQRPHLLRAVDDLTFDVESGKVTGFLGPQRRGESTTMRMVMGLDRPTAGSARVNGTRYVDLPAPLREVGALLDAAAMHPGRQVGLGKAAGRRIKGYSLGMRQRLGIAAALLGDPPVLLFDEPVNGLDLDGFRWIRALLRGFADEGRTVLVSSHLMSEMQLIADRVVIIGRGRLVVDSGIEEVLRGLGGQRVRVRTPAAEELQRGLAEQAAVDRTAPGELEITGLSASQVGDLAHALGVPVHHLAEVEQSLEHR